MNRKKLVTEMGRIDRDAFAQAEKLPLAVVLDNVRSLHNVVNACRKLIAGCLKIQIKMVNSIEPTVLQNT